MHINENKYFNRDTIIFLLPVEIPPPPKTKKLALKSNLTVTARFYCMVNLVEAIMLLFTFVLSLTRSWRKNPLQVTSCDSNQSLISNSKERCKSSETDIMDSCVI